MALLSGATKDERSLKVLDKNFQQDDKPWIIAEHKLARSKFKELYYIILQPMPTGTLSPGER